MTGEGPAKYTKSPVAKINAERPLALIIMWQSPHFARPQSEMRPRAVSTAGQKKGIFGQEQAKAGQQRCARRMIPAVFPVADWLAGASWRDRWYEPARHGTGCPDSRSRSLGSLRRDIQSRLRDRRAST